MTDLIESKFMSAPKFVQTVLEDGTKVVTLVKEPKHAAKEEKREEETESVNS